MTTIVIKGTLTTKGPLSIKLPPAEGKAASPWDNFPVETRGVDADGGKRLSGYLPATTLRGFLRRAIVTDAMMKAAADGKHYSLPRAYAELIGQDAESESKKTDTSKKAKDGAEGEGAEVEKKEETKYVDLLKIKQQREESPVLDLFGAGLGLSSRLLVSRFRPQVPVMPEIVVGCRKDLEDTPGVLENLSEADVTAYMGRNATNAQRAVVAAKVKDLERRVRAADKAAKAGKPGQPADELQAQLDVANAELAKLKDAMGGMSNSSQTIINHWALPMGLDLKGTIVVERARERDLPMLELALNALSMSPILGGHRARGCGEVEGTFEVFIDGVLKKTIKTGDWAPAVVTEFSGENPEIAA